MGAHPSTVLLKEPRDADRTRRPPLAAVVVAAILQEHASGFFSLFRRFRRRFAAAIAKVDEAADDAEHFAEVIRPLPGNGERRDRAGLAPPIPWRTRIFRSLFPC